jgi:hypothetical protein
MEGEEQPGSQEGKESNELKESDIKSNLNKLASWKDIGQKTKSWHDFVRNTLLLEKTLCHVCDNTIDKSLCVRADFRYKPYKDRWNEETICKACFFALQNPLFTFFAKENCYGYHGIMTQYKNKEMGWYYRDLRDLDDLQLSNPE